MHTHHDAALAEIQKFQEVEIANAKALRRRSEIEAGDAISRQTRIREKDAAKPTSKWRNETASDQSPSNIIRRNKNQ